MTLCHSVPGEAELPRRRACGPKSAWPTSRWRTLPDAAVVRALGLVAILTIPGASTTLGAQGPASADGTLNPGDVLRITVWRQPEFSGDFPVAADSTLIHPLYRAVKVAGVPFDTVEARLRAFLERFDANPQFVIQPLLRVIVGGEVNQPDVYTLGPETLIAQAVAAAGGPTREGRWDRVRVVRANLELFIDLTDPAVGPGFQQIRSGDVIMIERRGPTFGSIMLPILSFLAASASIVSIVLRF